MTHDDPAKLKSMAALLAIPPVNRWRTAQEVADACLFLCSSKPSLVRGVALVSRNFFCRSHKAKIDRLLTVGMLSSNGRTKMQLPVWKHEL